MTTTVQTHVLTIRDFHHPGRPPLTMNEWRNSHWAVKTKAKHRIYWQIVKALQEAGLRQTGKPLFDRITVRIVQFAPDARKRDNDGLGAFRKDVLDALKLSGVVPDDSREFVIDGGNDIRMDRTDPRVEIRINTEVFA